MAPAPDLMKSPTSPRPRARRTALLCFTIAIASPVSLRAFDWEQGDWGINVTNAGTPGTNPVLVTYPGGSESGNALEVHYRVAPVHLPQLWVFLTDGFWRQVAPGGTR